jgi:UDP-2,3-diacylglucosamine hydrolase
LRRDRRIPSTCAQDPSGRAERGSYDATQSTTSAELRSTGRTNASAPTWFVVMTRLGLIAGNGKFPFLVLDAARAQGLEVVVAAIREETSPEIESKGAASVHWLSLGELSKLIDTFKAAGVTRAVMAGQVKHKQIFSAIKPDWRLAKLLLSLGTRNTDSLLGAVAKVLADEGIVLENSTALLEPLLAKTGVLSTRAPSGQERKNIEYGRAVGRRLAEYDIGQTVVIAEAACVTVEAMEGTDATIERAGQLMRSLKLETELKSESEASTLSRALTVVKVAKPTQDMRFDVPVIGVKTIETMVRAGASCLAVDAGRCLLLDGEAMTRAADAAGIAVCAD